MLKGLLKRLWMFKKSLMQIRENIYLAIEKETARREYRTGGEVRKLMDGLFMRITQ